MAPNFQSSFIPKDPVTEHIFQKKKRGFLGTLVIFLFILSILLSIGMFFYKKMIKNDITNLQAELAEAEKSIDKKTIAEMALFQKKLSMIKGIIDEHQYISGFLELLSSSTVSSVYFTSFNYDGLSKEGIGVALQGRASSYGALALQEKTLLQNQSFRSPDFSNIYLTDKGAVSFDLRLTVDPNIFVYNP